MIRLFLHILAIVGAAIFLVPLVWAASTALKTTQQVNSPDSGVIPMSDRLIDANTGKRSKVTVINRISAPAATVKLLDGPRAGDTMAIERARVIEDASHQTHIKLAAAQPLAEVVRDFPQGVAEIRVEGIAAIKSADRYVSLDQLESYVDLRFDNFSRAWTALPVHFTRFVLNTYTITIINIIGQTLSCSLVAYGFARFNFRGRGALFLLLLSTMMLPGQVTMIPIFFLWNKLGLIDTFAPLTIPSFFASSAFFVFLLRQFFMGLPKELDEAAQLDGCGPFRIWWQILMPLCKPALTTVAVLAFIGNWDDFTGPLIYLNRLENYTVSLALRMFQDQNGADFNLMMAASLIHIVPVLVLFFVAQRYFVKGIAMSGMKG